METTTIRHVLKSSLNNEGLEERLAALEAKNAQLQESIRYAENLQRSILPNEILFKENFNDAFVLFQPKDILSGDFYWIFRHHSDIYFAVGDCTGHGIPAALVNIAGNTILRQIIRIEGLKDPAEIIRILDFEITGLFNDNLSKGKTYDGMDIAFCRFDMERMVGSFCGAGRPLFHIRDKQLTEYKKGLYAVGYNFANEKKQFETVHFDLRTGDQFYLFSDGYTDQFGGENVKKFNRLRFSHLLSSMAEMNMEKQKEELQFSFNNWKGKQEQIDDVCVIGVKI